MYSLVSSNEEKLNYLTTLANDHQREPSTATDKLTNHQLT